MGWIVTLSLAVAVAVQLLVADLVGASLSELVDELEQDRADVVRMPPGDG